MLPFHNSAQVYLRYLQFFSPLFPFWKHNRGFGVFIAQCICWHSCPKLPNKRVSPGSLQKQGGVTWAAVTSCPFAWGGSATSNLSLPSPGLMFKHIPGRERDMDVMPSCQKARGGGECHCWGKEDQILWLCSSFMPEPAFISVISEGKYYLSACVMPWVGVSHAGKT